MQIIKDLDKPELHVEINGIDVSDIAISATVVSNAQQEANLLTLVLVNEDFKALDIFDFNKYEITVYLGYHNWEDQINHSYMTKIFHGWSDPKKMKISQEAGNTITLTARDLTGILIDAALTIRFIGKTYSEIVEAIIKRTGMKYILNIPPGLNNVPYGATQEGYGEVYEVNQSTYWSALTQLASDCGLQVYFTFHQKTNEDILYFGVYEAYTRYCFEYCYGDRKDPDGFANLIDIEITKESPNAIVANCEIVSYNEDNQKVIYGQATNIPPYLKDKNGKDAGIIQKKTIYVANNMGYVKGMADVMAKYRLYEEQRKYYTAQLDSLIGIPYIQAGDFFNIVGVPGETWYFWIRSITHSISKNGGYKMSIDAEVPPYKLDLRDVPDEGGIFG